MTAKQAAHFVGRKLTGMSPVLMVSGGIGRRVQTSKAHVPRRPSSALQSRVRLVQAEIIETTLPISTEPSVLSTAIEASPSVSSTTPVAPATKATPSPTTPISVPFVKPSPIPKPTHKAAVKDEPRPVSPSSVPTPTLAPVGKTRTLRDEAGKLVSMPRFLFLVTYIADLASLAR
jgi:hypothetical protein